MRIDDTERNDRGPAAGVRQDDPPHVRAKAAARRIGVAPKTLANWRAAGKGPRYSRVGRAIVYRVADLDQFVESHLQ